MSVSENAGSSENLGIVFDGRFRSMMWTCAFMKANNLVAWSRLLLSWQRNCRTSKF